MAGLYKNATLEAVEALQRAPSILKINEIFRRTVEAYGYDNYLCAAPPRPDEDPLAPVLLDGWPREWRDRYIARNYISRDATVRMMFSTRDPFTWDDSIDQIRPEKKDLEIFHEARAWRMHRGIVVPMFGSGGQMNAVTVAGGADARIDAEARAQVHLVSMFAFGRAHFLRRRRQRRIRLTPRQAEVLQWVAYGKSDWEIGEVLGISKDTVHKHVEAAKEAFGVATRMQAVVAALRQGSIQI